MNHDSPMSRCTVDADSSYIDHMKDMEKKGLNTGVCPVCGNRWENHK